MCGISGFSFKDENKLAEMVGALSHRGPDATGTYVDNHCSLGHNRLSIIDLSASANQPMTLGDLVIIFNGEIYNYRELRSEIQEHKFETNSDTEVILAGYKVWGEKVLERLNGMFALAIYNKRSGELLLARDSFGVKPLYYHFSEGKLIFASELKALLVHDIPRKLNLNAFNRYLRILYSPEPETLVAGVMKLPPGNLLRFKGGEIKLDKFVGEAVVPSKLSYKEAVAETRERVMQAVERQMVADVPVGVYLSGGIDSSAILYSALQVNPKIESFSVGFELEVGEEEGKFNADLELARRTASHFGAKHHTLMISPSEASTTLERAVTQVDDLVSNPTAIPMLLLSAFAKERVSVILSGNGGDELFGGYDRYRQGLLARWAYSTSDLFAKFMFQKDDLLSRVVSKEVFEPASSIKKSFEKYLVGSDTVDALMNADRRSWLADQAFTLSDRLSMANALEERVPFLDNELVAFAESLPRRYKVGPFRTKKVLKDAFKGDLPDFLFDQPKRGWFSPGAKWLRRPEFVRLAKEILSPEYYPPTRDLFQWEEFNKILDDHLSKKVYNLSLIWSIISFQIWAKKYKINL